MVNTVHVRKVVERRKIRPRDVEEETVATDTANQGAAGVGATDHSKATGNGESAGAVQNFRGGHSTIVPSNVCFVGDTCA